MSRIPDDLIWEILIKLPPEIIHGCRTVCKSWLKLIQSRIFSKAQVEKTARVSSVKNRLIIVPGADGTTLYSVVFHLPENLKVAGVMELDYPKRDSEKKVIIVGTCNGLVCLENTKLYPNTNDFGYEYPSIDTSFTLWNPSTGIYRVVADKSNNSPDTWRKRKVYSFGSHCYFGYDCVKEDYHVVRVTMPSSEPRARPHGFVIDVYSLKNDKWTKIRKQDRIQDEWVIDVNSGVFIDGTLYLITKRKENDEPPFYHKMIAFDLATRNFRFIELPSQYNVCYTACYMESILGELQGRLCVLDSPWMSENKHVVWLMNDNDKHGTNELWSKKIEIKTSEPLILTKFLSVGACGGGADQQQVLGMFFYQHMTWCDTKTESNTEITIQRTSTEHLVEKETCVCLTTIASPYVV